VSGSVAFSSARKWSASSFDGHGSWVFGAPEMVLLGDAYDAIAEDVAREADAGKRVLVLAFSDHGLAGDQLPEALAGSALIFVEDQIRPDAAETLAYFAQQGVTLKVISGDNPRTVGAVGRRAGLAGADDFIDARELPSDPEALADAVERSTVFGRVTPHQKRAMVHALQSRGHVVAMTGDGVNDVLALKDADCGIAMASGSEASRAVAQLVLLDSSFSSLPVVVGEGRRVINNVERVASLFLVKTVYATLFAWATVISSVPFPFLPRHLTLVGTFTIGTPAFFLALAPSPEPVRAGFMGRVGRVALPGGVLASVSAFTAYIVARHHSGLTLTQERTTATLVLAASAVLVLARVARPLVPWKVALITSMASFLALSMVFPPLRHYFDLVLPTRPVVIWMVVIVAAEAVALPLVWRLADRVVGRFEKWHDGRPATIARKS
jgi:cation-transporting ATPase E